MPLDSLWKLPDFRQVFDEAPLGMALVDGQGVFLRVNRAVCEITGYSYEELLGSDFLLITHPDDRELFQRNAKRAWNGEADDFHAEFRYVHKQGHVVWTQTSASIVRDSSGRPYYGVAQLQDISERRRTERRVIQHAARFSRLTLAIEELSRILQTTSDRLLPESVVRVAMECVESPVGGFVCRRDDGLLVGHHVSETHTNVVRAQKACDLWDVALATARAQIDNSPRRMDCGRTLKRSLVAPLEVDGILLGVLHVGDAPRDYDEVDRELLTCVAKLAAPALRLPLQRQRLTPRELEIMEFIIDGMSQKQIATELQISFQTVAKHRAKLLQKMQVANDVELVRLAIQARSPYHSLPVRGECPPDTEPPRP